MPADWERPDGARRSRWVAVVGGLAAALLVALAVRGAGGGPSGVDVGGPEGAAPAVRELDTREPAEGVVIRVWEVDGRNEVGVSVDGEVAAFPLPAGRGTDDVRVTMAVLVGSERRPATVLALVVSERVAEVAARSAGGRDVTPPSGGVAVLAVPGWEPDVRVAVRSADGELLASENLQAVGQTVDLRSLTRVLLVDRATADGVRLVGSVRSCSPLAGDRCSPQARSLRVAVSTAEAVLAFTVSHLAGEPSSGMELVEARLLGEERGAPATVVVARAGPEVASVTARFADGGVDEARVVEGWAVVASRDAVAGRVRLEAIDDAGTIVATTEADATPDPAGVSP